MSAVSPIRAGIAWGSPVTPSFAVALPAGIRLLGVDDYGAENPERWCQLSFDVCGTADALQAAGLVTAKQLDALPKSGVKTFNVTIVDRPHCPVCTRTIVKRRKSGYRVDVTLYDANHPLLPKYRKMLGLLRSRPVLRLVVDNTVR